MNLARALSIGVLAGAVLFCPAPARAGLNASDWSFAGFNENYEVSAWNLPPSVWLESHSRLCADVLALTPDQTKSLDSIIAGAEHEFMYAWLERKETLIDDELRDQMKAPEEREKSWRERWKKMEQLQRELHAMREKLHAQILSDLRLVVTPEQGERWPDLERAMRRSFSLLELANLRFEGLDLASLIEALDPSADVAQSIGPTLAEYATELDPLIAARDQGATSLEDQAREARDLEEELQQSAESGEGSKSGTRHTANKYGRRSEQVVRAAASVLDASKRIADLNAMYLQRLQEHLPDTIAQKIRAIADTPLYVRRDNSWDQTSAHAALHLAENLSTFSGALTSWNLWSSSTREQAGINRIRDAVHPLTDEQSAKIKDIRTRFEEQDRLIRAKMEPDDEADPTRGNWLSVRVPTGYVSLRRNDTDENDSERKEKREAEFGKKRAELVLSTLKEVRETLDPEQRMLIAAYMW